jgi:hypothetical protein
MLMAVVLLLPVMRMKRQRVHKAIVWSTVCVLTAVLLLVVVLAVMKRRWPVSVLQYWRARDWLEVLLA